MKIMNDFLIFRLVIGTIIIIASEASIIRNFVPVKSPMNTVSKERVSLCRDFLKMDKKALAKFINFFLEDICQNHIKVICSYAQQ